MSERLHAALESRYRIERELGEGGTATVYLAEDLRHGRQVAVKVLRPELAAAVGAERFLAEIRTTAALQHPHILSLHDSGEAGGFLFYVMPFAKGESLRDRLDRERQLPVHEAVAIAEKVADALEYAHEQGVIHRDIKPANILLSRGEPLVADFGIALALSQAGGSRLTETGLNLGTPHYMSPEQATGEGSLDHRSDVYALGCVLYEMLVGERPFPGPTARAALAQILTSEPSRVSGIRRAVPAHVDAVVAKSLEKLPADRFSSAKALADALVNPSFEYGQMPHASSTGAVPAPARMDPRRLFERPGFFPAALGLAIVAIIAALATSWGPPRPATASGILPTHRFVLAEPGDFLTGLDGGVSIGPDGTVAYTEGMGSAGGSPFTEIGAGRIMVRFPGELRARPLVGTEGGRHPTFSPDGAQIAFTAGQELRKVPTRGGPVVALARTDTSLFIHPYWGPDGFIAVALDDGLYRVPEAGGTPVRVYQSAIEWGARTPMILPENAGWLFARAHRSSGPGARLDLVLLDPGTGETTLLAEGGTSPVWLTTGQVAFVHPSGSLFVAPFDLGRGAFGAPPAPVMDSLRYGAFTRTFAASSGGAAVYVTGAGLDPGAGAEIVLLGLSGAEDRFPTVVRSDLADGRFSPNGEKLAYTRDEHVWVLDLELGSHPRLTEGGARHRSPVWSPDGEGIAFSLSSGPGAAGRDIWFREVDGESVARPLLELEGDQDPMGWTEDGLLVFMTNHAGRSWDIYTVPADGSALPRPYLRADWHEESPSVSPDGRWLAYVSRERPESAVLLRSFPQPGPALLVSEPGVSAIEPVWSPDGSVVYYRQMPSEEIVAAELGTGPAFEVVRRRTVGRVTGPIRDVHPGGDWLLAFRWGLAESSGSDARMIGVVNWFTELAERLGGR